MTEQQLQEWLGKLEAHRGVGPDGDRHLCEETGRPYDTVARNVSGVIKPEGAPCDVYETPELAREAWVGAMLIYLSRRQTGKLHWRCRPELRTGKLYGHTGFDPEPEPNPLRYFIIARVSVG